MPEPAEPGTESAVEPEAGENDVFISYSRKDREFVRRLHAALVDAGKSTWVDWEDIPPASKFEQDLDEGVAKSHTFVFVISPDSVVSDFCRKELARADELGKRIVPLMHRPVDDDLPEPLGTHNWVPSEGCFEDDFERALKDLILAIETDHEWVRQHTYWGNRALQWAARERDGSLLLRGSELREAEAWMAARAGKTPEPTPRHDEFVAESRAGEQQRQQADSRRQRRIISGISVLLAVAVAAAIVALIQRSEANEQKRQAQSQALAAHAEAALESNLELSMLLAREAVRIEQTPAAEAILRKSMGTAPELLATIRHNTALEPARVIPGSTDLPHGGFAEARPYSVDSVAYSPSGRMVATVGTDGAARLWNPDTGKPIGSLRGHRDGAEVIAFDSRGRRIVTGGNDQKAIVWDARTRKPIRTFEGHVSKVMSVGFSPDDRTMVSTDGANAWAWDVASGDELGVFGHSGSVGSAAFTPDARRFVTGAWDAARVWDWHSGRLLRKLRGPFFAPLTPDGELTVTGGPGGNRTTRLWQVATGRLLAVLRGHRDYIQSGAFSPDGTLVVTASHDDTARVWSVPDGGLLTTLEGHADDVMDARFSRDGSRVITGSSDGTARIWDWNWTAGGELPGRGPISAADFSRDGRRLVTTGRREATTVWDPGRRRALRTLGRAPGPDDDYASAVALSPDGTRVATGTSGGGVQVWDASSGRVLETLRDPTDEFVETLAFSPDGRRVVGVVNDLELFTPSGSPLQPDGTAIIWEVSSGRKVTRVGGHENMINAAAFDADGERLVTGGDDGTVRVWDADSGRRLELLQAGRDPVTAVAFDAEGGRVAAGANGSVRVWELGEAGDGLLLRGATTGAALDFSPNGEFLVTAGYRLEVWDLSSESLVGVLARPGGLIIHASFDPTGSEVRSAADSTRLRPIGALRCRPCAPVDELVERARIRAGRDLTDAERREYLPDP